MELETEAEGNEREQARRPGILIQRLYHIHLARFAEECAGFAITPVQYSILAVIARREGMDQSQISDESGVDRLALAKIVARLEAIGYLKRITSRLDRRQKLLSLSPRGKAIVGAMREPVARAHARTIAALSAPEQETFLAQLATLVEAGNRGGRPKPRLK